MLGAVVGDIAGSAYEFHPWQGSWEDLPLFTEKSRFTDDTVMTMATAQTVMDRNVDDNTLYWNFMDNYHCFGHHYPKAGYGQRFAHWLMFDERDPYHSYGNGSAMRVSPVAWAYDHLEDVEQKAEISASVSHDHPEGLKGACAVAGAIFLARTGCDKWEIRDYIEGHYGYDLHRNLDQIRQKYKFEISCQASVPEAIIAFLESENFEEAIRKAIWLRGDADTQAAIAGSLAEAYYGGVPEQIAEAALARLDNNLRGKYRQWTRWLAQKEEPGDLA